MRTLIRPQRAAGLTSRRLIGAAGALCIGGVLCLCQAAFGQDVAKLQDAGTPKIRSKTGKADHELLLGGHAKFNHVNCASLEPPVIDLDVPPSHGVLCLRREKIELRFVYQERSLHCVGQKVNGVRIVYMPRRGYTGVDTLRYVVRFQIGPVTYTVNLTIEPNVPPSPGTVPADTTAPAGDAPQSRGPLPVCPALVS